MLDYKLPYHVLQEEDDETYIPKISFKNYEEAKEFVAFASSPNLIVVQTKKLKNYFLGHQKNKLLF